MDSGASFWQTPLGRMVKLVALLYLFFISIDLLSCSFKIFGLNYEQQFKAIIAVTANPLVALCLGILITSVIQSSSTTTSIIVAVVAEGSLPVSYAIPMIMGANIGTTVTGILVSLGHITRRQEFERAYSAATVHDFFNLLTVIVLLPLELSTHFLDRSSHWLTNAFVGVGGFKLMNPLKVVVSPASQLVRDTLFRFVDEGSIWGFVLLLVTSFVFLAVALKYLSNTIKSAISGRIERLVNDFLFSRVWRALLLGTLVTMLVQSSSVTTSLCVPLVAGGIFTLEAVYPFLLGANIGTTITAILASLVTGMPEAIAIALVHMLFNLCGTALWIWDPARRIPIGLARGLARLAIRNRMIALLYLLIVFFGIPLLVVFW